MKTYVLMISRQFPVSHPRKGQFTGFMKAIYDGRKIHTIRANYPLWEKRIKEVQEGKAILSIRYWEDQPYRSIQKECIRFDSSSKIGIQQLLFDEDNLDLPFINHGRYMMVYDLAKNDSLSEQDFRDWFKNYDLSGSMAIIHFTDFRY